MSARLERELLDGPSPQIATDSRRHGRDAVDGYICEIADGNYVVGGVVSDVSSSGLKIMNLSDRFSATHQCYVAVVSGEDKYYKVLIQPRWLKRAQGGDSMDVGFKVIDAPWEWTEFITM